MNAQIESQFLSTSLFSPSSSSSSSNSEKRRIAENPVKLVFYTDTDESTEYPIYVTENREIWIKKRPSQPIAVFNVEVTDIYNDLVPVRNDEELKKVLADAKVDEKTAELVKLAYTALRSLSSFAVFVKLFEAKYEVYRGDFAEYLGEASVRVVKLSAYAKFSTHEKQAWGIAYSSVKRIVAKYPQLADFVYPDVCYVRSVTDSSVTVTRRHTTPHAVVRIKIPVVTPEFEQLFSRALATTRLSISIVGELEKQIKQLEELIKQKEAELQQLREQLQNLRMKYELEKMKMLVSEVGDEQ